jgi:hypothetical protein
MPTKKCDICGEDVQNLQYKKHVAAHSESEQETIKEAVVTKPVEKKQDKPVSNPELAALIKQAQAAEAKMLEAPDVFFGEDSTNQHKALTRVHLPESLDDNAEWKAVFGDAKKRKEGYAAIAYHPIIDEKGSQVTDEGGNPMFKVRKDIYDGRKAVFQKESASRLRNVTQEAVKNTSASGLTEEELTIKKNE